jgi:ElaB/YqjD/DUF883 family membrane-anchored ribosome-binding protein
MFETKSSVPHNGLGGQVAQSADEAIQSTQRMVHEALDNLADTVHDVRRQASPVMHRANERAIAVARRGVDAVRNSSQRLRYQAGRAADGTVDYVKHEPVKSVLFAAAAGATLMALIGLAMRWSERE